MEKTNKQEFTPQKRWHSDKVYVLDGCKDLPATSHHDPDGDVDTINSIWKMNSIAERIKFLFNGTITLRVWGKAQPPVCVVNGDIFEQR